MTWRIRAAVAVGAVVWSLVVFQVTLWLTFPSEATAKFLAQEVATRLGGYTAEFGSVSPWWTGVSIRDVKVYGPSPTTTPGQAPVPTLVALADRVRGSVSPWGLLWGGYHVKGDVRLVEGQAHYAFGLVPDDRGRMMLTDLKVQSDGMPLGEILPLLPLSEAPSGTGALAIDVDIEAGEEGLRQATGHVTITGSNLVISDLSTESTGPLGMELPIAELHIEAPIEDGRATIAQGIASGELATIELEGDLVLRDPLSRSSLDLRLMLSNLGPALQPMAGFLGTPHSDGKYHFQVRGLASHPSVTPMRETVLTSPTGRVPSSSPTRTTSDGSATGPTSPMATETDEQREARREEARERLKQRREERDREAEQILATRGRPPVEDDEDPNVSHEPQEPEDVEQIPPDEEDVDPVFPVEDPEEDWTDPPQ